MDKELALLTLQKEIEKKKRKNENAKKMRDRRGEELREKNREYSRIHREKKKKLIEEAINIIKIEEKPSEPREPREPRVHPREPLPIKKDIVKIEKDRGEFISKVERTGIKGVSEKTATDYINKISVIHKIVSENELDKNLLKIILMGNGTKEDEKNLKLSMDYLDKIENLIKTIEERYHNLQSRKAHLSSYMTLISYLPNIKKEQYDIIRQRFEETNNEIYGIRGENERADKEEMIDTFEEEDIEKRANNLNLVDKIIYAFYTLQPPRRCEDVFMLTIIKDSKISDDRPNDHLDNDKNYIVVNEDNSPIEVIYNKYKTNKIYGRQRITISNPKLKSIIREYIYKNDIKEGERLYKKFSSAKTFGDAIKRVFSKVYEKKITLNNIRHSYITWEVRELRSVNYLTNLAMMMGHSMEEQQLYRRI
jgi:hypothetical protein